MTHHDGPSDTGDGETAALADFLASVTLADIPEEAQSDATLAIRDYLGVALYGSAHVTGETMAEYVATAAPGNTATLIGRGTASPAGAALANGTFGHAIDYDDTFESIVIHPTSVVFPAALAAADVVENAEAASDSSVTGTDVLTGYVAGVETAFRVGHATYPSHYDHGWHSTGTVGSFGAAAAAAVVLDLDAEAITRALGNVASCSSALKKNFGTMTKPMHPGHAAQAGLRAAMLADAGYTADPAILEGDMGYGEVMTPDGSYDSSVITEGLGDEWAVHDIGYKPYPSGVITHAAMEATRDLVVEHDLTVDDVETVTVTLDDAATEMLIHAEPADELQAKFSIEFCLAAILRERDVGVHEFTDEYVTDPATVDAISLVERDFEPNLFGDDFAGYGARIRLRTTDGTEYETEERRAPGSPTNPIADERLEAKFRECAEAVLPAEAVDEAVDAVENLAEPGALARLRDAVSSRNHEQS